MPLSSKQIEEVLKLKVEIIKEQELCRRAWEFFNLTYRKLTAPYHNNEAFDYLEKYFQEGIKYSHSPDKSYQLKLVNMLFQNLQNLNLQRNEIESIVSELQTP